MGDSLYQGWACPHVFSASFPPPKLLNVRRSPLATALCRLGGCCLPIDDVSQERSFELCHYTEWQVCSQRKVSLTSRTYIKLVETHSPQASSFRWYQCLLAPNFEYRFRHRPHSGQYGECWHQSCQSLGIQWYVLSVPQWYSPSISPL